MGIPLASSPVYHRGLGLSSLIALTVLFLVLLLCQGVHLLLWAQTAPSSLLSIDGVLHFYSCIHPLGPTLNSRRRKHLWPAVLLSCLVWFFVQDCLALSEYIFHLWLVFAELSLFSYAGPLLLSTALSVSPSNSEFADQAVWNFLLPSN